MGRDHKRRFCVSTSMYFLCTLEISHVHWMFVFYESINREIKIRPIYECRCDERLKPKDEESTRLTYTGLLGELENLKIRTRSIDEKFASIISDGWVCVCETMGVPSKLRVIMWRKDVTLARMELAFDLSCEENTMWRKWNWSRLCYSSWTPETAKIRSVFPMIL